jgi:hypothetical protein
MKGLSLVNVSPGKASSGADFLTAAVSFTGVLAFLETETFLANVRNFKRVSYNNELETGRAANASKICNLPGGAAHQT